MLAEYLIDLVMKPKNIPFDILSETSRRKILAHEGTQMMVEVTFDKGGEGAPHRHMHEQITYVAKGKFIFTIEGAQYTVAQGDSLYFPSNALHGCVCLEDGVLVDIFTPQREDFLKKEN